MVTRFLRSIYKYDNKSFGTCQIFFEPTTRVELATFSLQNYCTAIVLHRHLVARRMKIADLLLFYPAP